MRIIDWCSDLCSSDLRSNIPGERKLLISHVDAKPISDVGAIGDLKFGDPFEPGTNEHLQLHLRKECAYTKVDAAAQALMGYTLPLKIELHGIREDRILEVVHTSHPDHVIFFTTLKHGK